MNILRPQDIKALAIYNSQKFLNIGNFGVGS